jgi:RNA polymerase sigma-70 factor (ECF subfamily)
MTAMEFQYELANLQGSLMRFAYQLTADKEESKDLVQETFLKALKYKDKFSYECNFKAWTYTILKNTFINNYNRSVKQNTFNDKSADGFALKNLVTTNSHYPESIYASKEIERIIETLADELKLPFKMHHEGYRYKEIADALDLKLGTVKSRIFIARRKLMDRLSR